jgi:hypothetical protein
MMAVSVVMRAIKIQWWNLPLHKKASAINDFLGQRLGK